MISIDSHSHLIQLLVALSGGVLLFILSYMGLQRAVFKTLIVIIPFQFLTSVYGSFNMAATYMLGISMLLNQSWIKRKTRENWPLILPVLIIFLVFLISWTLAPRIFWGKTVFYMIMLGSNIFLFYMTYHFISDKDDVITFFNLLILCNILVIIYCVIQMFITEKGYSFLNISEFNIGAHSYVEGTRTSIKGGRILGPFNSVGTTAGYFVIQCILLFYYILNTNNYKKLTFILLFCNVALLIGTGNRGGFLSFLLSGFLYAYFFRKKIGLQKTIIFLISFFLILISSSYIMVKYTDYNVVYKKLLDTQMEGVVPDSRSGWGFVVEKIFEKPVLGHGPRLVTKGEYKEQVKWPKGEIGFWPHNLYLYILYTTGLIGFAAYCLLGFAYLRTLSKLRLRFNEKDNFLSGLPMLGIIIFIVFLFDQMKIEFLRPGLLDYQHYIFALFGMFCGLKKLK